MGVFSSDVKEVKIIWDPDPGRSYIPGEDISGKVVLRTEKDDVKIQKATIKIFGLLSIKVVEVR